MDDLPTLTTSDVARRLGVTRQTVARWIRERRLRAVRIAVGERSIYRITRAAFADFVRDYVREE